MYFYVSFSFSLFYYILQIIAITKDLSLIRSLIELLSDNEFYFLPFTLQFIKDDLSVKYFFLYATNHIFHKIIMIFF